MDSVREPRTERLVAKLMACLRLLVLPLMCTAWWHWSFNHHFCCVVIYHTILVNWQWTDGTISVSRATEQVKYYLMQDKTCWGFKCQRILLRGLVDHMLHQSFQRLGVELEDLSSHYGGVECWQKLWNAIITKLNAKLSLVSSKWPNHNSLQCCLNTTQFAMRKSCTRRTVDEYFTLVLF